TLHNEVRTKNLDAGGLGHLLRGQREHLLAHPRLAALAGALGLRSEEPEIEARKTEVATVEKEKPIERKVEVPIEKKIEAFEKRGEGAVEGKGERPLCEKKAGADPQRGAPPPVRPVVPPPPVQPVRAATPERPTHVRTVERAPVVEQAAPVRTVVEPERK